MRSPNYRPVALLAGLVIVLAGCTSSPEPSPTQETSSPFVSAATATDRSATLTAMTVSELRDALTSGKTTSVEITQAYLDRIGEYEESYNAFVSMNVGALEEAAASDKRRDAGEPRGPMDGIPMVVKDSIDVAGMPTTAGWSALTPSMGGLSLIPDTDAPVVARLKDAGVVIVGKTNQPIFAGSGSNANNSASGPTFSALNRQWAPGGSSVGSATAVAADFAAAALGEETGGSIQNPAAAQSLVAVKPTFGLIPSAGVVPLAGSRRDVVGPMTKTVEDAALLMDVLAGFDASDDKTVVALGQTPEKGYAAALSDTALDGARVGLYGPGWRTGDQSELTPETEELYRSAVTLLEEQGAIVVEDPFADTGFSSLAVTEPFGFDARGIEDNPHELEKYLQGLGKNSPVHSVAELSAATGVDMFGPDSPIMPNASDPTRPADMTSYDAVRAQYLDIFYTVMEEHDLDAMVLPQMTAPVGDLFTSTINGTTVSEINIPGLPGVVVPAGGYEDGQPFSLIFVGELFTEDVLLGLAYDFASAEPGRLVPDELETTAPPAP